LAEQLQRAAQQASGAGLNRQTGVLAGLAIRSLADMLDPLGAVSPNPTGPATTPIALVQAMRARGGTQSASDLRELAARLETLGLQQSDHEVLDSLARAADSEAAQARRRIVQR